MGDSHILPLLSGGMWGIGRGFVLIQDGGDRSHKDFWVYNRTWERTQVFTGICILGNPWATSRDDAIISSERYFRAKVYFKC